MPNMLTQDDLTAIGKVFDERFDVKFDEKLNDPEGVLNIKLDAMQEQLDDMQKDIGSIENQMVTKHFLTEKLADYVMRPREVQAGI